MFNYNLIKSNLKSVIDSVFNSSIVKQVVYKRLDGETFDPAAGQTIKTYSQYEIDVIESNVALQTSGMSTVLQAIGFSGGDKLYLIKFNELPRNPNDPDVLNDLIVDGKEYPIKKVIPVQDLLVYVQI